MASTFSISSFYLVSQKELFPGKWYRTFLYLPFLMALGIGLTITNTKAVLEALFGKQTAFARTPKYRVATKGDRQAEIAAKKYRKRLGIVPWIELAVGTYFAMTVWYAVSQRELHHRSVPGPVRLRLLVHRIDVAIAGTLRSPHGTRHSRTRFQALPRRRLDLIDSRAPRPTRASRVDVGFFRK